METDTITVESIGDYVTRKEAARLLKVTERTVINMQNDGLIKPAKMDGDGKTIYYRADDVEEIRISRGGRGTQTEDMIQDAAANMAMAPSAIIRATSESMRIAQSQVKELLGPVTAAMEMNMKLLMRENENLRSRCTQLEGEIFEFIDLQKKALREDHEGRLMEITELESQKMKREMFGRLMGYAPLLATLVGDKMGKSEGTRNVIRESALVDIVDKMSLDQLEALQKSGAFGQAEMATIFTMKQRLEDERAARLQKEAEAADDEEDILKG